MEKKFPFEVVLAAAMGGNKRIASKKGLIELYNHMVQQQGQILSKDRFSARKSCARKLLEEHSSLTTVVSDYQRDVVPYLTGQEDGKVIRAWVASKKETLFDNGFYSVKAGTVDPFAPVRTSYIGFIKGGKIGVVSPPTFG